MRHFILSIMSFFSGIFGACAQTPYTNVDVAGFKQVVTQDSAFILDVRTPQEYAEGHIANATNIDVHLPNFVEQAVQRLPQGRTIAVYCRSGKRSAMAAKMLTAKGFKVVNLLGGYMAWTAQ